MNIYVYCLFNSYKIFLSYDKKGFCSYDPHLLKIPNKTPGHRSPGRKDTQRTGKGVQVFVDGFEVYLPFIGAMGITDREIKLKGE